MIADLANHKRFIAVPDYTIVQACSHNILCVGGAISIDRQYRMNAWKENHRNFTTPKILTDAFARNLYWNNEAPLYDENKMDVICSQFTIDTVITHTAPSFCELFTKENLHHWIQNDDNLLGDIESKSAAAS